VHEDQVFVSVLEAFDRGFAAVRGAVSRITNTRRALLYGSTLMNCSTSLSNGTIPSFSSQRSNSLARLASQAAK